MITVEAASSADLAELTDQGAALFTEDAGRYDTYIDLTWSQRQGRVDFERLIGDPGSLVLVARVEGAVVGHLVGYTHEASATRLAVTFANLRSLYVEPTHRRRGAADLLVRQFIDWAHGQGCAEAHVDSYALNEPAQQLYQRHGFEVRSVARALAL